MKLLVLLALVGALVCAHPMDGSVDSSAVNEFGTAAVQKIEPPLIMTNSNLTTTMPPTNLTTTMTPTNLTTTMPPTNLTTTMTPTNLTTTMTPTNLTTTMPPTNLTTTMTPTNLTTTMPPTNLTTTMSPTNLTTTMTPTNLTTTMTPTNLTTTMTPKNLTTTMTPTNLTTTMTPTNLTTTMTPTNLTTTTTPGNSTTPTAAPTTLAPTTAAPPETQTCGGTISSTKTNSFVNPSYPFNDLIVVSPCQVRVDITDNNICQLRLDFESFSLSQPSAETSQCDTDAFRIFETGNDAFVPEICGENTGQHLYVDVDASSRGPILEMDIFNPPGPERFSRLWKIQVTQFQCDSVHRAPEGCQQYYNSSTGTVKSFNFKNPPSTAEEIGTGTGLQLHLANQNYQVCIMEQPGLCSIRWTPTAASTFVMTGFYIGNGAAIGTGNAWVDAYTGAQAGGAAPSPTTPCADYVIIPDGSYAAIDSVPYIPAGQSDRYCGGTFSTVTSTAQPFGLHVKTDGTEPVATESVNVGFSLNYRLLANGC